MLKLTPDPTFTVPVEITRPGVDVPAVVRVTYRYKNRDELEDFVKRYRDKSISDEDALYEVISSWEEVEEAFSRDALRALAKNYFTAPAELMEAYVKASTESRRKNSAR